MSFLEQCRERVRGRGLRIVYPEGTEERARQGAAQLASEGLAAPIVLGSPETIPGVLTLAPDDKYAERYFELRKHKGVTPDRAREKTLLPHYYAALMVASGHADGMVSGLSSATKPFLPAFEVIKLAPGFKRASSVFLMVWPDKVWFYADCSVNIDPDPPTLADIARATAGTARAFGIEPKVAFLSFSTQGSAHHGMVDHVKEAVRLCREAEPGLAADGEMQFDAAILPAIAAKKCPGSPVAGQANVFIFPDLDAGNIGYKMTERLGGAAAIGPILQGLNLPVNDVSRGCSVQDLVDVGVMTGIQAMARQACEH
jgi:phosphate acetyltransferase